MQKLAEFPYMHGSDVILAWQMTGASDRDLEVGRLKMSVSGMVHSWIEGEYSSALIESITEILLLLPVILISPVKVMCKISSILNKINDSKIINISHSYD